MPVTHIQYLTPANLKTNVMHDLMLYLCTLCCICGFYKNNDVSPDSQIRHSSGIENLETEQNSDNSISSHELSLDLHANLNKLFISTSIVNA